MANHPQPMKELGPFFGWFEKEAKRRPPGLPNFCEARLPTRLFPSPLEVLVEQRTPGQGPISDASASVGQLTFHDLDLDAPRLGSSESKLRRVHGPEKKSGFCGVSLVQHGQMASGKNPVPSQSPLK